MQPVPVNACPRVDRCKLVWTHPAEVLCGKVACGFDPGVCLFWGAAMLQQPRVPPTGQRQAIEIQIKWREVLAQKQAMLRILARTTGHSEEKLDKARP